MRVAVTGGTGFVGSHTVAHLLAHGHQPRLLVRDPAKAERVLGARRRRPRRRSSSSSVTWATPTAVAELLDGAEAVIHAAAAIGVTGPRTDLVAQNVHGMENVVGAAVERGLDPVIHVSTVAVFVPPDRVGDHPRRAARVAAHGLRPLEARRRALRPAAPGRRGARHDRLPGRRRRARTSRPSTR